MTKYILGAAIRLEDGRWSVRRETAKHGSSPCTLGHRAHRDVSDDHFGDIDAAFTAHHPMIVERVSPAGDLM
jgi:hypothetical protein